MSQYPKMYISINAHRYYTLKDLNKCQRGKDIEDPEFLFSDCF